MIARRPCVAPAGKVRVPGTKTLYSVLGCDDLVFLDLLEACLRWGPLGWRLLQRSAARLRVAPAQSAATKRAPIGGVMPEAPLGRPGLPGRPAAHHSPPLPTRLLYSTTQVGPRAAHHPGAGAGAPLV